MPTEELYFNGINAATGDYLLPPMAPRDVSKIAQGESLEEAHLQELKHWYERLTLKHLGPKEGVDPKNLAQSGWGVIFAYEDIDQTPAISFTVVKQRPRGCLTLPWISFTRPTSSGPFRAGMISFTSWLTTG